MVEKLARVPFTVAEEDTISSMAHWMRFIAVLGIIGGILMLVLVVAGIGLFSAARGLGETSPEWSPRLTRFFNEAGGILYFLFVVGLLAAVAAIWQNFALYHAGDSFNQVAHTDIADVDYLAHGLDKLRLYFKIQVLVVVVFVAVAFGTALVTMAVLQRT